MKSRQSLQLALGILTYVLVRLSSFVTPKKKKKQYMFGN